MYRPLNTLIAPLALLVSACVFAPATYASEDHTPVEDTMDAMQSAYRKVGRAMRKPAENLTDLLGWVQEMQMGAVAAKVMEIKIPAGMGDAAAVQKKYRLEMTKTVIALVELEQTLLEEDFEAAKAAFDKVKALKSEGHDQFKIED